MKGVLIKLIEHIITTTTTTLFIFLSFGVFFPRQEGGRKKKLLVQGKCDVGGYVMKNPMVFDAAQ